MSSLSNFKKSALVLMLAGSLAACGDNDNNDPIEDQEPVVVVEPEPVVYEFTITFSNLTAGQPLSPLSVIAFDDTAPWQFGESASVGLEMIAESGANEEYLSDENALAAVSAEGAIGPGETTSVTISVDAQDVLNLSFAAMLGNTNDAFTGLSSVDVSALEVGSSISRTTAAYDAGTEANTETADTVPGPAAGGEGFNEIRDDIADMITMHPGIVSNQDGLSTSALGAELKFDNPVSKIVITRTQ
ncbi:spondin domain-containing protein [Pseudoalteromonas sp. MMG006]|uniref:spondin domain-containing protein n=1 Tax=unclassified Pseudoalteromonas TaxID=194690 RepID=UPI001B3686B3|nr:MULTISPECIES: spondin domain-containing protein [unclassified Pseudoalteromonas]MBQ4799936.1 spondin domain-containing protein [Pseudoalteromonas sp. MMG006]MBQ4859411.1 spondin domain-containing protein [Pseudoalteromonas sp. MMG007]